MLSLIITLVVILIIILCIVLAIKWILNQLSNFSGILFGSQSLKTGIENMQKNYAKTPRSISAMTSLCLPKIIEDFPDFNYDEMKERAKNLLISYLQAVDEKRISILTDGGSELTNKLSLYLNMLNNREETEHYKNIKMHRIEISQYKKAEGRCTITFQASIQYYHYVVNKEGTIFSGSDNQFFQAKYDIDLIYIQDRDQVENSFDQALGLNCPNCGGTITSLGAKVCEYCGSPVIEYNIHAWTFSDLKEYESL